MFHKKALNNVVLLVGSNMGVRLDNLNFAIEALKNAGIKITATSKRYESESWGFKGGNFINQVIIIKTALTPIQLLDLTQTIERKAGRTRRNNVGYESRTLDIDILFVNEQVIEHDRLKVPHPKIQERRFTLEPLNEVIPGYKHPVLFKTIEELKKECPDKSVVKALATRVREK